MSPKLNRSHLIHGKRAYILPALGRTELDIQNGNKQTVTVEDSFSMVHGSTGMLTPASEHCRSEPWIIAGLAKATVAGCARIDWDLLVSDYSLIRDKIEAGLPEQFEGYNDRMRQPGGFKVVAYDVPPGCCAAYYPETNALLPLSHRDERNNTPAAKSAPVRISAARPGKPVSSEPDVAETYPDRPPLTVPAA